MNCCESIGESSLKIEKADQKIACPSCGSVGHSVQHRTLYHHVSADHIHRVKQQSYWFCNSAKCEVVYYNGFGDLFRTYEVREVISSKSEENVFPLCYCFGFSSKHIRNRVQSNLTKASDIIRDFIRAGICECEIRNPAGKCCLGTVLSFEKQSK